MADAAVKTKPATTTAEDTERELTDGFHLVIDALKPVSYTHLTLPTNREV